MRWSHDGRFLASGSDDTVIVIWGIDPLVGGHSLAGLGTDIEVEMEEEEYLDQMKSTWRIGRL